MEVSLSGKIVSIDTNRLHWHKSSLLFFLCTPNHTDTDTPQASLTYDRLTYDRIISFASFPAVHHHLKKRDCPVRRRFRSLETIFRLNQTFCIIFLQAYGSFVKRKNRLHRPKSSPSSKIVSLFLLCAPKHADILIHRKPTTALFLLPLSRPYTTTFKNGIVQNVLLILRPKERLEKVGPRTRTPSHLAWMVKLTYDFVEGVSTCVDAVILFRQIRISNVTGLNRRVITDSRFNHSTLDKLVQNLAAQRMPCAIVGILGWRVNVPKLQ